MAKKETTKKSVTPKKATPKTSKKTTVKTSKKAAPKTSVKTRTPVQAHAVKSSKKKESVAHVTDTKKTTAEPVKKNSFQFRKPYLFFALGIILLGALLYFGRGLFVAAVVNGQPISRIAVINEAEKQSGRQALDTLVRNTLIEQEARKAGITVSDQEIDEEVKKVEDTLSKQGQKLDDVLAIQGMTQTDLRKLIRLDKLVSKIVGQDVKVTDKEVDDYLAANKEFLPQDQSEEELRKAATEQLKQQKLNDKVRTWLESLQTKAKVQYFVQY